MVKGWFECRKKGNRSLRIVAFFTINSSKFTKSRKGSTDGVKDFAPAGLWMTHKWKYVVLKNVRSKSSTASGIRGQPLESLINIARWTWWDPLLSIPTRRLRRGMISTTPVPATAMRWRYRVFFAREPFFFSIMAQSCRWLSPRWVWSHGSERSKPQPKRHDQVSDQCNTLVKYPSLI